ncbi:AAA domain-containing protein [Chitinimonas sp. BJYL2]|uniref:AAA domain-containing protein n=1 Tax=Chitinimonas sp. BJYL2 TaxID=2976696 RepID=UPI0022B5693F|nr:AAA domain-containing protein [Chitinimonas sp. BJYL2]
MRRIVSIYVDEQNKTEQISDWTICRSDKREALELTCHFSSGRKLIRPLSNCRVEPVRELGAMLLTRLGDVVAQPIEKATIYGERYAVVHYPRGTKPYVFKLDKIQLTNQTTLKETPVFRYFIEVANARKARAGTKDQRQIFDNVVQQLNRLPPSPDTALHAYCTGRNATRVLDGGLVYPFGVNESQLAAVERAFSSQISVIEGPPGTGKTQTILNILANILLRGKTVAVLSNNNAAVENVYEKLDKSGLGHLVAKLGSKDNQEAFFANLPSWPSAEPERAPAMDEIQATLTRLRRYLRDHNEAAQLQADIAELIIEQRFLRQWQDENGVLAPTSLDKYQLSPSKTADLMAYLSYLGEQRIRLKDRIELLFNFKIFRVKPFATETRLSFFYALQMHYYEKALQEKEAALQARNESLALGNFTSLLQALTTGSMHYLKRRLHKSAVEEHSFDAQTYKKTNFDAFVRRFPILGSSTHSIVNSMPPGAILDYVIIDEASQQDIVPGILALGCAKNLIIVGDNRQLAHIPVALGLPAPDDIYDCERYSLLDSCIGVFKDTLPRTLLKEHYRCHPRIIQFCNQQFYNNALLPMTKDAGEAPLRLVVTAKGNHARMNTNLRELDSLLKVLENDGECVELDADGRGFIAPFRGQVTLSGAHLPVDFVKETVHKFQGRECDEIVFSTVLDKKRHNQKSNRLNFVDDPRMVNVAVSRAKHRFTLVTGDEVFSANNGHIAALIRYMEYYTQEKQIVRAPVVSAFDLLYKEYDQSLARLNARLRPDDSRYKSEQIVAQLLREALSNEPFRALTFYPQITLSQLASSTNAALTEQERTFMRNRASCDFVLYFKVGKTPLGVIEVDGGSHHRPEQSARDALKNSILAKSDLPILRLSTVESGIEKKIAGFLATWAHTTSNEGRTTAN